MQFKIIDDNAKLPPVSNTQQAETLPPLSPLRQRWRFGRRSSRHSSTSKRCRWSSGDLASSRATCQKPLPIPSRPEEYRTITQKDHFGFPTSIVETTSLSCAAPYQHDSTPRLPCHPKFIKRSLCRRAAELDFRGRVDVRAAGLLPGAAARGQQCFKKQNGKQQASAAETHAENSDGVVGKDGVPARSPLKGR